MVHPLDEWMTDRSRNGGRLIANKLSLLRRHTENSPPVSFRATSVGQNGDTDSDTREVCIQTAVTVAVTLVFTVA